MGGGESTPTATAMAPVDAGKVTIAGDEVAVTSEPGLEHKAALESVPFNDWRKSVDHRFKVKALHIQSVDMFGKGHVGFIKFKADLVERKSGRFLPGIVFMRGGSVAVLVCLKCEGKKYTVVCHQPRFPAGRFSFPEIPAGMLDGSGNFAGIAAKEMEEETGIIMKQTELVDMSGLVYGERYRGVFPSPGGCDEFIRLYYFEKSVDAKTLADMQGRHTGNMAEGEVITLQIVPLDHTADAKTLSAVLLHDYLEKNGKLKAGGGAAGSA